MNENSKQLTRKDIQALAISTFTSGYCCNKFVSLFLSDGPDKYDDMFLISIYVVGLILSASVYFWKYFRITEIVKK